MATSGETTTSVRRRDPFTRLSTPARLWAAALLALMAPGLDASGQTFTTFLPGTTLYGNCGTADPGTLCAPDVTIPGQVITGSVNPAVHTELRALVWVCALVLVGLAVRRRTLTSQRVARVASAGLLLAVLLGVALRSPLVVIDAGLASLLAVPPAWGGRGRDFGTLDARR